MTESMKIEFGARIACLVASLCTAAYAQVEMPRVDEIVEVRIINFDVVVIDARGNHVRGLTKDDFELYENGKRQEITNFSEYSIERSGDGVASAPGVALPARRIVIFFDVVSTSTFERKRAVAALARFIDNLRADDEIMVVSWNRRLDIVVPATHDRDLVKAGLTKVSRELAVRSADSLLRERATSSAEARTVNRMRERAAVIDLQQSAAAMTAVLTRLTGLDGRKALLLITNGFAARIQDAVEPATEDLDAAQVVQKLARTANAAGVTLYGVHARGLESGMSVEDTDPSLSDVRARTSSASVEGLRHLAGRTGGLVAANTNYFRKALDNIAADLSTYYSIAYRAQSRRVSGEKNVEIRVRNRDHHVRARRSLVERTFDEEIADGVVSTLFFPVRANDLKIAGEVGSAERQKKNRYAVALDVHIPYEMLAFTPEGDDLVADLSIYIGSADAKGSTSAVKRFDQKVRVARPRFPTIAGKRYRYGFDVDLTTVAGDHRIAVAVLDNISKSTGYAVVDLGKLPARK